MGWMKIIHGYAAYRVHRAVLVRVIWMFTGNRYAHWDKFIPVHRTRRQGYPGRRCKFYLFARNKPPEYVGHNPVAGADIHARIRAVFPRDRNGLMLRGASADVGSPVRWFAGLAPLFGGLQVARWIHHVVMWLLLGFPVHHVYSGILMSIHREANATMDSIFSGYKFVPREELEFSGYRFINRQ